MIHDEETDKMKSISTKHHNPPSVPIALIIYINVLSLVTGMLLGSIVFIVIAILMMWKG